INGAHPQLQPNQGVNIDSASEWIANGETRAFLARHFSGREGKNVLKATRTWIDLGLPEVRHGTSDLASSRRVVRIRHASNRDRYGLVLRRRRVGDGQQADRPLVATIENHGLIGKLQPLDMPQ